MGKKLVEIVEEALGKEVIPATRTYPGGKMQAIENVFATVGLKELDPAAGTATVLVSILSPAQDGAEICEDEGLRACRILKSIGGTCRQGEVSYDSRGDYLCVPIEAVFVGHETIVGWSPAKSAPTFTVKVENVVWEYAVSFDSEYTVDTTDPSAVKKYWTFRLEEIIPLNRQENAIPQEPFCISVVKEYSEDVYSGCRITGQKRMFREDGFHHIWEGAATTVTVVC